MSEKTQPRTSKDRILVTGSNGLLGTAICDALRHDYDVIGFDVEHDSGRREGVENIRVDLTDEVSVAHGLEGARLSSEGHFVSVIHLAAYYDFSGEPSDLYDKVTVEGTRRLLRGLRGFEVDQFQYASSMLVHAPTEPGRPIDEAWPIEPKWDYPKSKVWAEKVVADERGQIPAVILRVAGVYTDLCDSIPLAQQMARIYENRLTSHVYPGDVTRGQAFVHLDDVVRAVVLAVEHRDELPEFLPLLIGESDTMGYGELQEEFGRLLRGEEEWFTEQIPKSVAKAGAWLQDRIPGVEDPFIKPWMIDLADDHFELDIRAARRYLNWSPEHALRDTVPKMARALLDDPEGWYRHHGLDPTEILEREEQDTVHPRYVF